MDFFSEQDQARRSTKLLVALFSIKVNSIIIITNILVAMTLWLVNEQIAGNYQAYQGALDTLVYQETPGLTDYISRKYWFANNHHRRTGCANQVDSIV